MALRNFPLLGATFRYTILDLCNGFDASVRRSRWRPTAPQSYLTSRRRESASMLCAPPHLPHTCRRPRLSSARGCAADCDAFGELGISAEALDGMHEVRARQWPAALCTRALRNHALGTERAVEPLRCVNAAAVERALSERETLTAV